MSLITDKFSNIEAQIQITGKWNNKTAYVFHILGRRKGFTSTSVWNDVKEFDNAVADVPFLAGSEALEVVSDNVNDTAAGTGARTVKIVYINNSGALTESAAITLNGTTAVATGFTANGILWMENVTVGSNMVSVGNIILRNATDHTTQYEQITANGNKSMSGRFLVPTGFTAYLNTNWHMSAIGGADQDTRIRATVNSFDRSLNAGNVFHFQDIMYIPNSMAMEMGVPWIKFPAGCRIKVSTLSSATGNTNRIDANYTVVLIAN